MIPDTTFLVVISIIPKVTGRPGRRIEREEKTLIWIPTQSGCNALDKRWATRAVVKLC